VTKYFRINPRLIALNRKVMLLFRREDLLVVGGSGAGGAGSSSADFSRASNSMILAALIEF